jgi:hypothetical protein
MRTVVIKAGIVPDMDTPAGRASVNFVTEGEVSFNFSATHSEAGKYLKVNHTPPRIGCLYVRSPENKFGSLTPVAGSST